MSETWKNGSTLCNRDNPELPEYETNRSAETFPYAPPRQRKIRELKRNFRRELFIYLHCVDILLWPLSHGWQLKLGTWIGLCLHKSSKFQRPHISVPISNFWIIANRIPCTPLSRVKISSKCRRSYIHNIWLHSSQQTILYTERKQVMQW
jgi:hypothetical protein